MTDSPSRYQQVATAARCIHDGFLDYNRAFREITARAGRRFEERDWKGQMADIAARVELYELWARRTVEILRTELGEDLAGHAFWAEVRECFGLRV